MASHCLTVLIVFALTVAPFLFLCVANVTCAVLFVSVLVCVLTLFLWTLRQRDAGTERRVCVLVLGDIGRSPRVQYHSLALSRNGYDVTFVGFFAILDYDAVAAVICYVHLANNCRSFNNGQLLCCHRLFRDTNPHPDVLRDEKIKIVPIAEVMGIQVGSKMITYVTKVIIQFLQLLYLLLKMERQTHILMQNPPGLPGIAVAWLMCVLRGSRFIIDWHNYGYTIMSLSHGPRHPIVQLAKWYEHIFGRLAANNLCVTNAMKEDLQKNWGIKATTLYDRPASIFRETPLKQQHQLFLRLAEAYPQFQYSGPEGQEGEVENTIFSSYDLTGDLVTLREGRPVLLLSSTSWTEDEDFSVLLTALEEYDGFVKEGASLPSLVCVITGKGPQKEFYRKLIDSLHLEHVKICTPWLEAKDYPVLLGSADLGVCLHKSSSGLDLPMKVVDMFGCCLPVCAIHFSCLHELVKHEENGLIFRDSKELVQQLKTLLSDFPGSDSKLSVFRRNLRATRGQCWDDNWDQHVLPLLTGLL